MIKSIVISMLMISLALSKPLEVGDTILSFSLPDQFDAVHQVNSKDYKTIVIAFEKDMAVMLNDYLKEQPSTFLTSNKALFISDIHTMPSFVTNLFALPKMKKYSYSLLLLYEEKDIFPKQENALTVLKTQENKIVKIEYVKDTKEIETIFN